MLAFEGNRKHVGETFSADMPASSDGSRVARSRARRKPQGATQIASRFAKDATRQKRKNRMIVKWTRGAMACVALAGLAQTARAQDATPLTNGAYLTLTNGPRSGTGITSVDLGSASTTGIITQMPMSLTYGSTTLNVSFTGQSSLYRDPAHKWSPVPGNFLSALNGSITMDFSRSQRYLSMMWGSQDNANQVSFYNQGQLITSITGAPVRAMTTALNGTSTGYTSFSFSELTFDRVVLSSSVQSMEIASLSFSESPQVAPIPLHAGSLGGLLAFLGMMGARGGGWRMQMRLIASRLRGGKQVEGFA